MEQGQIQVYTGNGKGKTTAAIGLSIRALGAGKKVYMGQFIKDMEYSECSILKALPGMTLELYGSGDGCFIDRVPQQKDLDAAAEGIQKIKDAMTSGQYDVIIADEINVAWALKLLEKEAFLGLVDSKPEDVELIFTGRGCPQFILDRADLITEMKEVRHYYTEKGLLSRKGIEC